MSFEAVLGNKEFELVVFGVTFWSNVLKWFTGHCNRAVASRNRYGVENTVDTHTILINAIKFYVCLQEI